MPTKKYTNWDLLFMAATACFGHQWKRPTAKILGYSVKAFDRWQRGESPVPATLRSGMTLPEALMKLLESREIEIEKAKERISKYVD